MKKLIGLLIAVLMVMPAVLAVDIGTGVGINMETEKFEPLIWMCDHRLVLDDNVETGRVSAGGELLVERINNYAFEGEQIVWDALVMDKNGIEKIEDVYVTVGDVQGAGNDIEVECVELNGITENGCYGTPEEGVCENYDYEQCMEIDGCELLCDRYVDNTDDCDSHTPCYTTIQDAVNAANNNDVICILDGAYTISSPIVIQGRNGLSIVGNSENPEAVTITTTVVTWQANIFNLMNSDYITLDGMKLVINTKQGDPIILTHDPALGVTSGSDYNTIRNVITNGGWEGIRVENSNHNTIEYNVFEEAWHGIFIQGHSWGSTVGSDYNVIENNVIHNNYGELSVSGLSTSKGILVLGSAGTIIRNNLIQGGPGPGESLLTLNCIGVFASIDNTIENNEMENCKIGMTAAGKAGYGITIDIPSTFTSFEHNNIVGNSLFGVESFLIAVIDAENNWWGCPTGANTGTCDKTFGSVDYDPWSQSEFDIPDSEPQKTPICEGTPRSCQVIQDEFKCNEETPGCEWFTPEICNARIAEEEITEFDSDTMAYYNCVFTVETPNSMYGEYWVTGEVTDLDGLSSTWDENEYWFLNPEIALGIEGTLDFGVVRPGTMSYSPTLLVGNAADDSSGVLLDMFVSGTDFYDPSSSGAKCPITNQLALTNFDYYAVNGAYGTQLDPRNDAEGYVGIEYGNAFTTLFYNNAEIMQTPVNAEGYYAGNILAPGAEIAITFRLDLPEPCNGDFTDGSIYFWGEAI